MEQQNIVRKFVRLSVISEHLKCPICLDVFTSPMRLSCGHTFCQCCLKKYIEGSKKCPQCRREIQQEMIGQDRLASQIINELQVFCPVNQCPWKGQLQLLNTHTENQCLFKGFIGGNEDDEREGLDDDILDKINQNVIKGSLAARIANKASLYEKYMIDSDPDRRNREKNLLIQFPNLENHKQPIQKSENQLNHQKYRQYGKNGIISKLQPPKKLNFQSQHQLISRQKEPSKDASYYLEELFDESFE